MPTTSFDDTAVRQAMAAYLAAAQALDEAADTGSEPRVLVDLAEVKAVAGLELRKRLESLGWTAPSTQRTAT